MSVAVLPRNSAEGETVLCVRRGRSARSPWITQTRNQRVAGGWVEERSAAEWF